MSKVQQDPVFLRLHACASDMGLSVLGQIVPPGLASGDFTVYLPN